MSDNQTQQMQVGVQPFAADVLGDRQQVVVMVSVDADSDAIHHCAPNTGSSGASADPSVPCGTLHLRNLDRDDSRQHAIAKRFPS